MEGHTGITEARINIVCLITHCSKAKAAKALLALQEAETGQPTTAGPKQYDTPTQAASMLCGVGKPTFLGYVRSYPDELPYVKLGCAFKFSRRDVEAFMQRRVNNS